MTEKNRGIALLLCLFAFQFAFATSFSSFENPKSPSLPPPEDLNLYPFSTQDTLSAGDQYCVEIRVDGFIDIIGYQFSLNWNPDALRFDSLRNFNLPDMDLNNFGYPPLIADGNITAIWTFTAGSMYTVPDGTSLFEACFTVLPGADTLNTVSISGVPTSIEFVNSSEDILNVIPGSTEIHVPTAISTPELEIIGGQATVDPGGAVCIPVQVNGFEGISGLQFSINWDTEQLTFTGVQGFNLPDLSEFNFDLSTAADQGIIRFIWTESGTSGVTQADGTTIFELCFEASGSLEVAAVDFTGSPLPIAATDVLDNDVPVVTTSGEITINGIPMWPGDTDLSELVDQFDLLNIGLAYGETGPARPNASLTWVEQTAALWDYATPNSLVNAAHIDADGNGTVNDGDVLALDQNYGEVTTFWNGGDENRSPLLPTALTLADPALIVEPQTVNPGQEATFNILFGDETTPVEGAYGLAFTVVYDALGIVPGSVSASFDDSWLGNVNGELITISKDHSDNNRIDIAMSRINQQSQDGQGIIAQINLTVAEIIQEENYPISFEIENPRIINAQEELIPSVHPITFSEIMGTVSTDNAELNRKVAIYPIPTSDILHIQTDQLQIEMLEILSLDGKVLQHSETDLSQISTAKLPAGSYILQVNTKEGVLHKRFVKL